MRSAICLSGLVRTYERTHSSFVKNVVAPLRDQGEVDVFISTWDTVDIEALSPRWWGVKHEEPVDLNRVAQLYRPRVMEVENFESLRPAFQLANFTSKPCPIPAIVKDGVLLSMPAQYKVLRANNLKRMVELATNARYDIVVRMRFDMEIERLRLDEWDMVKINCLWDRHDGIMGDCFYGAGSAQMDAVCDVFNNYRYLLNIEGTDMGPERNLRNHVTQLGLQTKVMQDYNFVLVREWHRDQCHWNTKTPGYDPNNRDRRMPT